MKSKKQLLFFSLIILVGIIAIELLIGLTPVNNALELQIVENPLPKLYFPMFFMVGILFPLLIRTIKSFKIYIYELIDPYLSLLAFQIFVEVLVLLLFGKGITVIVGLLFSMIRLVQLVYFLSFTDCVLILKIFLYSQIILWAFNISQITFNRIIPLF